MKSFKEQQNKKCNISENTESLQTKIDFWIEYSRKQQLVAKAHSTPLYTIIQPQQYLGKKALSAEEKQIFSTRSKQNQEKVGREYGLAISKFMKEFSDSKIVIDSTEVFHDQKKTLYSDANCHLTDEGYELFAERIVYPIILAELNKQKNVFQ